MRNLDRASSQPHAPHAARNVDGGEERSRRRQGGTGVRWADRLGIALRAEWRGRSREAEGPRSGGLRAAPALPPHRTRDKNSAYRWYNDYRLPERLGAGIVTVRLHANDQDRTRHFNRTENVRPIPPSDPDFARLYARRNDAESINRNLEDTLFLGRAHSVGRLRQQVDLIGYALLVNGLTVLRHEATRQAPHGRLNRSRLPPAWLGSVRTT